MNEIELAQLFIDYKKAQEILQGIFNREIYATMEGDCRGAWRKS
jgi:hypothetical protein